MLSKDPKVTQSCVATIKRLHMEFYALVFRNCHRNVAENNYALIFKVLSDFINLTQVHNFTVSAKDIFTFRRHSVFTVSFSRILQVQMQIMKHFALYYRLVKWFWYRVYNQKVLSSSPRKFFFFFFLIFTSLFDSFNFIIIDVPRPLNNVFWSIIFQRLMRYTEPVCLEHLRASK